MEWRVLKEVAKKQQVTFANILRQKTDASGAAEKGMFEPSGCLYSRTFDDTTEPPEDP